MLRNIGPAFAGLKLAGVGLAFALLSAPAALAQPANQPIRLLFGFAAGSAGDTLTRIVADRMQTVLGQSVVVENRVGASAKIALLAVKNAPPDGTLLYIGPNGPMTITPHYDSNAGYDPQTDFTPISQLVTFEFSIGVSPKLLPATNLAEMIALVKSKPELGSYGTPGGGSNPHFIAINLANAAKIDLRAVHYRGSVPALNDVIAGQLPMMVTPLSDQIEQAKAGNLRIIATSDKVRSIFAPEVPTFIEQGFPVEALGWYAAYGPPNLPRPIVERLNKIMAEAVRAPEVKGRLDALGFKATATSPEGLAEQQKKEIDYWRPIVKASGFKAD
jgi:tripartite-type tricarboxylate transporter receptor subunit TctC